jgi:hypothetical protein
LLPCLFIKNILTKKLTPWRKTILEKLIVVQLAQKFHHFMEPKGSLPCSEEPATGPYPEPDESPFP